MAVMTEELVPALEDARQAHAAVLDRLRADATVTPAGPHRQMLERRAAEVQVGVQRIQRQVRDLQPQGLVGTAANMTRYVSHGAVRTAMLPLNIGAAAVKGMLPGRRPADARRLLRNTESEYSAAARALATCRAGEVLAEQVDDETTAELLASLRRQDEELLLELEESLAEHARAVAESAAGFGPGPSGDGGLADAAVRTVRTAIVQAGDVIQSGVRKAKDVAEGAVRQGARPSPSPCPEEVLGAVRSEEDLPIHGFSQLSTDQIHRRLGTLSQSDLTVIEAYERTHARRKGVLDAIERLRGEQPWAGYDTMDPDEITLRVRDVPVDQARRVQEYEQHHRRRQEVVSAAQDRMRG
ncbi:hypothetical protein ABZ915_02120 [Streptomyces sp. NPDC046915]|uniref:hypothetical protein n=1 Tax=Streptomyces sp. NPDC046915 TaxID=3155257 RepID=UPI0033E165BD